MDKEDLIVAFVIFVMFLIPLLVVYLLYGYLSPVTFWEKAVFIILGVGTYIAVFVLEVSLLALAS